MPADNILWFSLLFSLWQKSFSVGRGSGSCGQRCMDWGCHCDRWVAWLVGGGGFRRGALHARLHCQSFVCHYCGCWRLLCAAVTRFSSPFPRLFLALAAWLCPSWSQSCVCCCGLLKTFTALKDPPTETNDAHPFAPAHPDRCSCSFSFSLWMLITPAAVTTAKARICFGPGPASEAAVRHF